MPQSAGGKLIADITVVFIEFTPSGTSSLNAKESNTQYFQWTKLGGANTERRIAKTRLFAQVSEKRIHCNFLPLDEKVGSCCTKVDSAVSMVVLAQLNANSGTGFNCMLTHRST